jgi:TonB family protein
MTTDYRTTIDVRPSTFRIGFAVLLLATGLWQITATLADTSPGYQYRYVTRAVDANRKAHFSVDYPNGRPPWIDDLIHRVQPKYPYADRSAHREGDGLYRLSLDLENGTVTKVWVVRSAGSESMDESAVAAVQQWHFKPGKWREVVCRCRSSCRARAPTASTEEGLGWQSEVGSQ